MENISPVSIIQKSFNVYFNTFIYDNLEKREIDDAKLWEKTSYYELVQKINAKYVTTDYSEFAIWLLYFHKKIFRNIGLEETISFETAKNIFQEFIEFYVDCFRKSERLEILKTELMPKMKKFFKSLDDLFKTDHFSKTLISAIMQELRKLRPQKFLEKNGDYQARIQKIYEDKKALAKPIWVRVSDFLTRN